MTAEAAIDQTKPYFKIAPNLDDCRDDPRSAAIYWLAFACAHFKAFDDVIRSGSTEDVAKASHAHLWPYMAGFTIAATQEGWTQAGIHDALESGDVAAELTWEWLTKAGIDPDQIRSASDLIPMVERRLAAMAAGVQP